MKRALSLVAAMAVVVGCGSGQKSNSDDKSFGNLAEGVFAACILNGEGPTGGGGHCDDGVTETQRLLSQVNGLDLSQDDRKRLLARAANDAEPYCTVCADMLDRAAR